MLRLILIFCVSLVPLHAKAVEINEQGAQTLQKSFQNLLDYQKTINEAFGSVRVMYDGDLTVSQEEGYYAITLPHIFLQSPTVENHTEDMVFDMGVITVNAMPDEKPGYWKATMAFPSQMTMSDKTPNNANDDFTVTFGEQETMAIFNDKLGYFTKMNVNLSDIGFKAGEKDPGISVGGIQLYTNLSEENGDTFSGPGHILFSDLLIGPPEQKNTVKMGELKLDFTMNGFKLPTLQEYQQKLLKHAATFQSLNKLEEDGNTEAIDGENLINMITDLYDFDMDGFSFQYNIKGLDVSMNDKEKPEDIKSVKIESAFAGMGLNGLKAPKGTLSIKSGYNNVAVLPEIPEQKSLFPQNVNFDIEAKNIPYNTLTELAQTTGKSIAQNPESAQMVGLGVLMRIPALLSQSGTEIVVKNNGIENETYAINLDGKIITDLTALMGFSAKFKAVFEGIDNLINIYEKNENLENMGDTDKILKTLKSVGTEETGPNGKPAHVFVLETTPEGKALINGQDATTLFAE